MSTRSRTVRIDPSGDGLSLTCSECGITWTADAVVECPRCRYKPRGGEAIGLLGCFIFSLLGAPALVLTLIVIFIGVKDPPLIRLF